MRRGRDRRERQTQFLRALQQTGTVYHACRQSKVSRTIVYEWLEDPKFQQRFQTARENAVERLETSAFRRALKGDTSLTMFLLKAMRPEVYREKYEAPTDEEKLNAAIADQLARLAAGGTQEAPRIIDGTIEHAAGTVASKAERIP